jgi:hypothetical protein
MDAVISESIEGPRGLDYYLDRRAVQLRSLANEHRASGRDAMANNLTRIADELTARAATLRARRPAQCGGLWMAMLHRDLERRN